jgi:hypothetical protein
MELENPENRAMFDRVYDFFFGDQLRKYVVLISAIFLSQLFVIPFFGQLEPSQYVVLGVIISFMFIWPLTLLYNRFGPIQRRSTKETAHGDIARPDKDLINQRIEELQQRRKELHEQILKTSHETVNNRIQTPVEMLEKINSEFTLLQTRMKQELHEVIESNRVRREEMMKLLERIDSREPINVEEIREELKVFIEDNNRLSDLSIIIVNCLTR